MDKDKNILMWELYQEYVNVNVYSNKINNILLKEILISIKQDYPSNGFISICSRLSNHLIVNFNFNLEHRKIINQKGLKHALLYYKNFNPLISTNVFAYITQIIRSGQAIYLDNIKK